MINPAIAVSLLALGAAQVRPEQVPATGRQEAIVTLDRPQMVRLTAQSAHGTACELTDHLRGPFIRDGQAGKQSCALELLLDAGTYKLRLDSPRKGKGNVKLAVTPFQELSQPVPRLEPRRRAERVLHPGQQASYWIHLDQRQPVLLLVAGRTAGEVALWRNGEWREELAPRHAVESPRPGQPIHRWVLEGVLEAGNYLLTAYGASAAEWSQGKSDDELEVAFSIPLGPPERTASLTLPFSGQSYLELPKGPSIASLALDAPPAAAVTLALYPISLEGRALEKSRPTESCTIQAKQPVPTCAMQARADSRYVLEVKGPPGTTAALTWAPFGGGELEDGTFGPPQQTITFVAPRTGEFLVASNDLVADSDSAPVSCRIEHLQPDRREELVADDFLKVGDDRPFSRAFNYGSDETLWFELTNMSLYRIATSGGRGSHCELFRINGSERERVTDPDPKATTCDVRKLLRPGPYELRLYGGTRGIERLLIARGTAAVQDTATKTGCRFDRLNLTAKERYRITFSRVGAVVARGLVLRERPVALERPLSLRLEKNEIVSLPIGAGDQLRVRAVGDGRFRCALGAGAAVAAQEGRCTLPARTAADTLTLTNNGPEGITVSVQPVPPATPLPPLLAFSPKLAPLPALALDAQVNLDFAREEAHSFTFDVKQPGLYDVTTTGLLSTSCAVRTAIIAKLAADESAGRGRNCLLSNYLRPGHYLLTVKATGQSRGRAGVVLHREPILELAPVAGEGQAFFRAGPGQLVQERLSAKRAGPYRLSTTALGASLQCRLEDKDGWPVVAVPTPCAANEQLAAGTYLWMQLPLTVPSMRHTVLAPIRPNPPLRGNTPHAIALNTCYAAQLGKKGEDDYRFTLQAETDLHVLLTRRMQGRLYRLEADGSRKPVEVIAPQDFASQATPPPGQGNDEGGEGGEGAEPPPEPQGDESPPPELAEPAESAESESAEHAESYSPPSPCPASSARPGAPAVPQGAVVHLLPGKYALLAQHSRGDVGVAYQIQLGTDVLAPGVTLALRAPVEVPLRMPQSSTFRLRTQGDTDVRCRIFDLDGRLRYESSENGDDWNCALAEPLAAGDYRLVIESETQVPGPTQVAAELPPVEELGTLENGKVLALKGSVAVGLVPPPETPDGVREVVLASRQRFSCALEDPRGALLYRETQVTTCAFLLRPGPGAYRLRAWTLERPAQVSVALATKTFTEAGGSLGPAAAVKAAIQRPGRYATSAGVRCLPDAERGVLRPCGPEVSLDAGPVVFAVAGAREPVRLSLEEIIPGLDKPLSEPFAFERRPFIERQSSRQAIQLVVARAEPGERAAPACSLDPGARTLAEGTCFAASGVGRETILRAWAPSDEPVAGTLERLAAPYPAEAIPLTPGRRHYALPAPQARLRAPDRAWRAELTLPPASWAVTLDGAGRATDLCPPREALSACALEGVGGELFIHAPKEPALDVELLLLAQSPRPLALGALYEAQLPAPGSLRMTVPAAAMDRTLDVEGALRCAIRRDDGLRLTGCGAPLPAGMGAVVLVQHEAGAVRATVRTGGANTARMGPIAEPASPAEALPAAFAAPLTGALVQKTITLDKQQVVRVRSDSGVCGLWSAGNLLSQSGLGGGCDVSRLLGPGTYRMAVRRFADVPLSGTVAWTGEPVEELKEGVGPERWVAPGEQRTFLFTTASPGRLGLGVQAGADSLECEVRDPGDTLLGTGCQQFLQLPAGDFLLSIRAPASTPAMRFRPVVLGLAGADLGVPDEYLRDFFTRIGGTP